MARQLAKFKFYTPSFFGIRQWGRYGGLWMVSVCLVCLLGTSALTGTSALAQTSLTWEDLQPTTHTLQNPYGHLSIEQTYELSTLAQLKIWVDENEASPASLEAQEIARLEKKFKAQDLDVDALLSQVDQAQAYWQQQSQSTNQQWTGETVQLSGYVLPLTRNQAEQVTEFLLVPFVGACIHVPPPPPNQIIYVEPPQPLEVPGLFTAVEVVGELRSQPATYDVFQVDGSRPVEVSYGLSLRQLTRSEISQDTFPQMSLGPSSGNRWQRLQTKISTLLTQAMGTVEQQRSPMAFLWGILMAFSYGVLHTLGPGHGKAVIITYFVGQGGSLRRGITMGIRIAIFHVLSAILIVALTTLVLRQSAPDNYRVVQLVSYGAIATIGGWMLWRAVPWRAISGQHFSPKSEPAYLGAKEADLLMYPNLTQQITAPAACSCVTCVEPKRASDWLALAIGSVPCSGALLILLYGSANNLLWPSIIMVMAISLGMAITLAWIGTLALMGRNYAERRVSKRPLQRWQPWLKFAGSGCVLLLGLGLFGLTLVSG